MRKTTQIWSRKQERCGATGYYALTCGYIIISRHTYVLQALVTIYRDYMIKLALLSLVFFFLTFFTMQVTFQR